MNVLLNYPSFKEDILNAFKNIIGKYDFELIDISEGVYELVNESSILRIAYDRGDIYIFIIDPYDETDKKYALLSVLNYLHPQLEFKNSIFEPKAKLDYLSDLVFNNLQNVLAGDFKWKQGLNDEQSYKRKLLNYVSNVIDRKNPIFDKFINGDLSWMKDLQTYLIENNIAL